MADIFLSYASADRPRVKPIVDGLTQQGWTVWWDHHSLRAGQTWDDMIEQAIDTARCVVVLWSHQSVQSKWVRTEATEGDQREILVPALIDEVKIPLAFRLLHAANLVGWSGQSPFPQFDALVDAIGHTLARSASQAVLAAAVPEVIVSAPPLVAPAGKVVVPPTPIIPPAPTLTAGQVRVNPKDGLPYVWIPPGLFLMGASPGDGEVYDDEKPAHEVTLTKGFWLGQTPVTVGAYNRFLAAAGQPPRPVNDPDLPAVDVNWHHAKAYAEWAGLRLPSEAEWEYAARAGTTGSRYGPLGDVGWFSANSGWRPGNSGGNVHPVGLKQPNGWDLHDMLGNVIEWVNDWYAEYSAVAAVDPPGPVDGSIRVARGGSWYDFARGVRASCRHRDWPTAQNAKLGFRCSGELH